MDYFISYTDNNGYIYSIDNLVLEYSLKNKTENLIEFIHDLINKYPDIKDEEYFESLNKPYSSRWQYYNNFIHLCKGFSIWFGKWSISHNGDKIIYPIVKVEFNPNKHADKDIVKEFMYYIFENMGDSELRKYDFAIDIKCKKEDIQVLGSRKDKGLYKGTRYYGQRNKDGYCKIYDKKVESDLDDDLTRVEHTLVHNKQGKNKKHGLNFENIYVKTINEDVKLNTKTKQCIYELCVLCDLHNLDYDNALSKIDRRLKKEIIDALNGGIYKKLDIDIDLHDKMIDKIYDIYHILRIHKPLIEDVNGFIKLDDDYELPFE